MSISVNGNITAQAIPNDHAKTSEEISKQHVLSKQQTTVSKSLFHTCINLNILSLPGLYPI